MRFCCFIVTMHIAENKRERVATINIESNATGQMWETIGDY